MTWYYFLGIYFRHSSIDSDKDKAILNHLPHHHHITHHQKYNPEGESIALTLPRDIVIIIILIAYVFFHREWTSVCSRPTHYPHSSEPQRISKPTMDISWEKWITMAVLTIVSIILGLVPSYIFRSVSKMLLSIKSCSPYLAVLVLEFCYLHFFFMSYQKYEKVL